MYTRHGHHITGTDTIGKPNLVARCGGPGLCPDCNADYVYAKKGLESQTEKSMEFTTFVRKPFIVEAVEITAENIGELADLVGALREKEDGTPYIQVDRRLVPNIFRVYPGFWMTRMGDNIRCYSQKVFREQFARNEPDIETWVKFMNGSPNKNIFGTSN